MRLPLAAPDEEDPKKFILDESQTRELGLLEHDFHLIQTFAHLLNGKLVVDTTEYEETNSNYEVVLVQPFDTGNQISTARPVSLRTIVFP